MTREYIIVLCLLVCGSQALGDVVINVEIDPPSPANSNTVVTFSATSTTAQEISGFNIPIDFGGTATTGDGEGLPLGFGFASTPITGPTSFGPPALNTGQNSVFDIDGIINGGPASPAIELSLIPTILAELVISIDPGVAPGTFAYVHIVNPTTGFNQFNFSGPSGNIDVSEISIPAGSGSVTVVPEPSAFTLVGLIALLVLLKSRWVKKSNADS